MICLTSATVISCNAVLTIRFPTILSKEFPDEIAASRDICELIVKFPPSDEFSELLSFLQPVKIKVIIKKKEGSIVKKNDVVATIEGRAENILIGERVALNFLSHISGIATKTNQFVKLVNKNCKICCTRKSIN